VKFNILKTLNSLRFVHNYKSKKVLELMQKNYWNVDDIISEIISKGKPALIGRFGGAEIKILSCIVDLISLKFILDPFSTLYSIITLKRRLTQGRDLSGFYPINYKSVKYFYQTYKEAIINSDLIGCWGAIDTSYEYNAYKFKHSKIIPFMATSPWVETYQLSNKSIKPWSMALEGKKILVISSFSESFNKQISRINSIFYKVKYPSFDLQFIDAPMTQGGNPLTSWKQNLELVKQQMETFDFDIALISAGTYAYPLANHAKKIGKIGINCGGELQLFFGVIGKRWENTSKVNRYFNKNWVRPNINERPKNWRDIENGCFW
jgi:hypothetical protein